MYHGAKTQLRSISFRRQKAEISDALSVIFKLALCSFGIACAYYGDLWLYADVAVCSVAVVVGLSLMAFDRFIIYPRFRSPLRRLPVVRGGISDCFFDKLLRGKSAPYLTRDPNPRDATFQRIPGVPLFYQMPLMWAEQHPEAEIYNSRGWLGHAELYPVGPQALKDLFSTNAYDFVKPAGTRDYMSHVFAFGRGLLTVEGTEHSGLRRKVQPAFKKTNIRALYPTMWQKAGVLTSKLAKEMEAEGKVDIYAWVSKFGLDVIGIGAVSQEFHALEMKELHPIAEASAEATAGDRESWRYFVTSIALPQWAVRHIYPKHAKIVTRRAQFLRKTGKEIYEAGQARLQDKALSKESILGEIIQEPGLDRESVVDNILTFIGAGHDTSVASITLACHLLTLPENIKYQQILREDLHAHLPELSNNHEWESPPPALRHALEESPFLNAICEEALRLFPPVPTAVRHAIRQTTIAGTEIPKGTLIVVMPWAINRNPRYWGEDAATFRPERWIDQTEDGKLRANKHGGAASNFNGATFLHGPHACIGRDFNRAEMKCALAAIFSQFKVEKWGDCASKVKITGYITIKPEGGLHVKLTPIK